MTPNLLSTYSAPTRSTLAPTLPPVVERDPKIWAAAQEFEAVLLGELTNLMSETSETPSAFGGGQAENIWRSQLGSHIGSGIAKRGGLGLAESVYAQMLKMQGGNQAAAPQAAFVNSALQTYSTVGGKQ
jgi:peptidoglycan hydrolase FlgJ